MVEIPMAAMVGLAAVLVAVLGVGGGALYRLGKLAQEVAYTRESVNQEVSHSREVQQKDSENLRESQEKAIEGLRESQENLRNMLLREIEHSREMERAEHEATRAEIRRLTDALLSHYHDEDGNVRFRIPPPLGGGA